MWSSRTSFVLIPEERKLETSVLYGFSLALHRRTSDFIGKNYGRYEKVISHPNTSPGDFNCTSSKRVRPAKYSVLCEMDDCEIDY